MKDLNQLLEDFKTAKGVRDRNVQTLIERILGKLTALPDVRELPGVTFEVPTSEIWDQTHGHGLKGNPLLTGWLVIVIYRFKTRPGGPAVYYHTDYGSFLSRLDNRGQRWAKKTGDLVFLPFNDCGQPLYSGTFEPIPSPGYGVFEGQK